MKTLAMTLLFLVAGGAQATGTYQTPTDFINEVFAGQPPAAQMLWFTGEIKDTADRILTHPPHQLRTRYWRKQQRSAWILEEIGKEKPITVGIVVNNGRIETLRVLIFRESRGWEVRHGFFTDQFTQAHLGNDLQLDKPIDGISGATLSVNALIRLARLALYLHTHSRDAA